MSDILNEIVEVKKIEILKEKKKKLKFNNLAKTNKNFLKALSKNKVNIIAEIKKASPSEGIIRENFKPAKIAEIYDNYVDAISVLTDEKFFKGKIEFINKIRSKTSLPVLRKDFIIDEYQIYRSRYYGADAILLIAAILTEEQINRFLDIAHSFNMYCLVEVHNKQELDKVLKTKAEIIGINNRDLKTFKTDINTTIKLAKLIPKDKIIVTESAIKTRNDINRLKNIVNGFLVGTSIMRSENIEIKLKEFVKTKIKICGLTNLLDAKKADELGADFLGFIFYKRSSRYIEPIKVKNIIDKLNSNSRKVGVFVNEEIEKVVKIINLCSLDIVQLHGNETNEYIDKLRELTDIKIIKAFRIKNELNENEILNLKSDFVLFDSYVKGIPGGTGKTFDISLIKNVNYNRIFMSGGLNCENILDIIKKLDPYCVDICSGIEIEPAKKDHKKMIELFKNIRGN